jgi:uncharacterized protein
MHTEVITINDFELESFHEGLTTCWFKVVSNSFGNDINIPIMVLKGKFPGPVFGITSLVHGDELNGLSVVQKIFTKVNPNTLRGTIIGLPVINVPGFLRKERNFSDGRDLNHKFPGKPDGAESSIYAFHIFSKIIKKFDYLLDLHTARAGNVNSFYIRANLKNTKIKTLSLLLNSLIVLSCEGGKGTLRKQANEHGVTAITLELGDPNEFQKEIISQAVKGIYNCLIYLKMQEGTVQLDSNPMICSSSSKIHTKEGGILQVLPDIGKMVQTGEKIAVVKNIFGGVVHEYFAPEEGVIIGKSINPTNHAGSRIIHLGKIKK